jgi:hypothetical protein
MSPPFGESLRSFLCWLLKPWRTTKREFASSFDLQENMQIVALWPEEASDKRGNQAGGSSRLAWNSAKYLANIVSVSITSVKPACISLIVETIAGGPGLLRP